LLFYFFCHHDIMHHKHCIFKIKIFHFQNIFKKKERKGEKRFEILAARLTSKGSRPSFHVFTGCRFPPDTFPGAPPAPSPQPPRTAAHSLAAASPPPPLQSSQHAAHLAKSATKRTPKEKAKTLAASLEHAQHHAGIS
jgi:hypothetical protein